MRVLTGEVEALFDLHAVNLYESFTRYLVGNLGNVLVRKAAAKVFLQCGLKARDGDEGVFRSSLARASRMTRRISSSMAGRMRMNRL
jgi:hypothetical protein